jgi:hypothetical protein|tara:strand:+ start:611 stop:943 length:333 start_codon:yes stop_codon:yes gene_type:complete
MSFFESEIVQEEMKEIARLQEAVYSKLFAFAHMGKREKLEHVEMLETLLKKQQVLYTRLSLSDDPQAQIMKENIIKSAKELGFPPNIDLGHMFANITGVVENMRKSIDES